KRGAGPSELSQHLDSQTEAGRASPSRKHFRAERRGRRSRTLIGEHCRDQREEDRKMPPALEKNGGGQARHHEENRGRRAPPDSIEQIPAKQGAAASRQIGGYEGQTNLRGAPAAIALGIETEKRNHRATDQTDAIAQDCNEDHTPRPRAAHRFEAS